MNADRLMRKALSLGAELEIEGRRINAGRAQVKAARPQPAADAPPPPSPPAAAVPAAGVTLEQVQSLLNACNAQWREQFDSLADTFTLALQAVATAASAAKPGGGHTIKFKYDDFGAIVGADVAPAPSGVGQAGKTR